MNAAQCYFRVFYFKEIIVGQPVVHWEFWSQDTAKLGEFYQKVFGWEIQAIPDIGYNLVNTGGSGGINGGMMTPKAGPWPFTLMCRRLNLSAKRSARLAGKWWWRKWKFPE